MSESQADAVELSREKSKKSVKKRPEASCPVTSPSAGRRSVNNRSKWKEERAETQSAEVRGGNLEVRGGTLAVAESSAEEKQPVAAVAVAVAVAVAALSWDWKSGVSHQVNWMKDFSATVQARHLQLS